MEHLLSSVELKVSQYFCIEFNTFYSPSPDPDTQVEETAFHASFITHFKASGTVEIFAVSQR
jgi:hypothetical protein